MNTQIKIIIGILAIMSVGCRKDPTIVAIKADVSTTFESPIARYLGSYSGEWDRETSFYSDFMDDDEDPISTTTYTSGMTTINVDSIGLESIIFSSFIDFYYNKNLRIFKVAPDKTIFYNSEIHPSNDEIIEVTFKGENLDSLYVHTYYAFGSSSEASSYSESFVTDYKLARD